MSKLEKISFAHFGKIIDRKDDFCRKHQIDFENECHLLPSGKHHWMGCPKCQIEIEKENDKREQQNFELEHKQKIKESETQAVTQKYEKATGF